MRRLLINVAVGLYAVALLPAYIAALIICWREPSLIGGRFYWISPMEYAQNNRSTGNAVFASVCWFIVISAIEALYKHL